jgi:steroid delta-isomerase-like uncharacterized protein
MTTEAPTTPTDARTVVRSYFEALGRRDRDAQLNWYAPDGGGRFYGLTAEPNTRDESRQFFHELFDAFPDFSLEILDLIVEGDQVAVRWRATGTFTGSSRFLGLLPTGQRLDLEGVDIVQVRDGKIASIDAYTDTSEMARQLGAMPPRDSLGDKATLGAVNLITRARQFIQSRR